MKSLLDLQQDIRNLERNIMEITCAVKEINADIENMRTANQNTDMDYSKIELLAQNITFSKHPIDKLEDGRACQIYLEMLLNMVRLDPECEVTINRLVFIQWLQKESKLDWSLEDLYKDCFTINSDVYHEMVDAIPKKFRDYFMVDLLIVANIGGAANVEIYEYIAGIASIFGLDKNKISLLSQVAKVALCQQIVRMNKKEMDEFQIVAHSFKYYIGADLLDAGIKSMRQIVVELSDNDASNFKWKVKQGQEVSKGDVLATYRKAARTKGYSFSTDYVTEEILAPLSGTIFQFRNNCINYGVIAYENDNKDSIKAWVKERR